MFTTSYLDLYSLLDHAAREITFRSLHISQIRTDFKTDHHYFKYKFYSCCSFVRFPFLFSHFGLWILFPIGKSFLSQMFNVIHYMSSFRIAVLSWISLWRFSHEAAHATPQLWPLHLHMKYLYKMSVTKNAEFSSRETFISCLVMLESSVNIIWSHFFTINREDLREIKAREENINWSSVKYTFHLLVSWTK